MRRTARTHLATRQHDWTSLLLHPPLLCRVMHHRALLHGELFATAAGHNLRRPVHYLGVRVQLLLGPRTLQWRHIRQAVVACPHYAKSATSAHQAHCHGIHDGVLRVLSNTATHSRVHQTILDTQIVVIEIQIRVVIVHALVPRVLDHVVRGAARR